MKLTNEFASNPIIHFGAFDHNNVGDWIYPILWRKLTGYETAICGLTARQMPEYATMAIDSADSSIPVLVGGGDLLGSTSLYDFFKLPKWPAECGEGFRLKRKAVYASVGVPHSTSQSINGWIWARDYHSALNLPKWPDIVAPDMAVLSSKAFPVAESKQQVALVQSAFVSSETVPAIKQLMKEYEVQLISTTAWAGDAEAMSPVALALGLTVTVVPTVMELVSRIATAALVVAASMHANILAFSYGVPHLFPPTPFMSKIPGFLEVVGLPQHLALQSWKECDPARCISDPVLRERAQRMTLTAVKETVKALRIM